MKRGLVLRAGGAQALELGKESVGGPGWRHRMEIISDRLTQQPAIHQVRFSVIYPCGL